MVKSIMFLLINEIILGKKIIGRIYGMTYYLLLIMSQYIIWDRLYSKTKEINDILLSTDSSD